MYENIKTSLGLGVSTTYNIFEIMISLCWMFLGLSLFGYGIGNISSYLNYANQSEIEHQDYIIYFTDLCSKHHIDSKVLDLIKLDIENHFDKDNEYQDKSKVLGKKLQLQLETILLKNFINSFKLLQNLNTTTIKELKSNCSIGDSELILRKENVINDIYLVTKGSIRIFDEFMNLINVYNKNDIFGMVQFKNLIYDKYKIDLNLLINENTSIKTQNYNSNYDILIKLQSYGTTDYCPNVITVVNDNVTSIFPFHALGCDGVQYININFDVLEEIMLKDIHTFYKFFNYCYDELDPIDVLDIETYTLNINRFNSLECSAFILLESGYIYDLNKYMYDSFDGIGYELETKDFKYNYIYDIIEIKNNEDDLSEFKAQQFLSKEDFDLKKYDGKLSIQNYWKTNIIRDERNNSSYYRLKKSMYQGFVVEFTLKDDYIASYN